MWFIFTLNNRHLNSIYLFKKTTWSEPTDWCHSTEVAFMQQQQNQLSLCCSFKFNNEQRKKKKKNQFSTSNLWRFELELQSASIVFFVAGSQWERVMCLYHPHVILKVWPLGSKENSSYWIQLETLWNKSIMIIPTQIDSRDNLSISECWRQLLLLCGSRCASLLNTNTLVCVSCFQVLYLCPPL